MIDYAKLKLAHANLNRPVHILLGRVCGYHHSENTMSTHVYTPAGVFPVKESVEEIDNLITELTERSQNERSTRK